MHGGDNIKKTVSAFLNAAVSCFLAAVILFLLWMIYSGEHTGGTFHVGFSENGDVLHFFDEILYISRDDVMRVLSYPSRAAQFCMRFLPLTVSEYIRFAAKSLSSGFIAFFSLFFGALDAFLTLGTNL